jgi:hypothetical protein
MKTYLSIDIDYWREHTPWIAFQDMDRFFLKVIDLKAPIYIVNNHHKILRDVNRRKFDTLINMDFHSDITCYIDRDGGVYEYYQMPQKQSIKGDLNCGTWVNFVKNRTEGEFIWIYPKYECLEDDGRCEDIEGFWDSPQSKYHNWAKITCQKGWSEYIPWGTVKAVGIALSSPWLFEELEVYFMLSIFPKLACEGARISQCFADRRLSMFKDRI